MDLNVEELINDHHNKWGISEIYQENIILGP